MAIEPIGSVSAMQLQSTVKVQPKVTQAEVENKDVNMTDSAVPMVDATTMSVAKAAETNTQNEDSDKRENTQAEKAKL